MLAEMIEHPDANPDRRAVWVRRQTLKKKFGLRETLIKLRERGEIGRRA